MLVQTFTLGLGLVGAFGLVSVGADRAADTCSERCIVENESSDCATNPWQQASNSCDDPDCSYGIRARTSGCANGMCVEDMSSDCVQSAACSVIWHVEYRSGCSVDIVIAETGGTDCSCFAGCESFINRDPETPWTLVEQPATLTNCGDACSLDVSIKPTNSLCVLATLTLTYDCGSCAP